MAVIKSASLKFHPLVKPGDPVKLVDLSAQAGTTAIAEIEAAVLAISNLGKQLDASRLKRRAVLVLLQDMTGLSLTDIGKVLGALPELEATYLKPRVN